MALTRIKNNQLTDNSIEAGSKLADLSITAGKIANDLNYGSNLTVTGNLTVNGTSTTLDTVNTIIEDPVLLLGKDQTGVPAFDLGFVGERGDENNAAFVWKESADEFQFGLTTGTADGNTITLASFADTQAKDMTMVNLAPSGNVTTALNASSTIAAGSSITAVTTITATGNVAGGNLTTAAAMDSATINTTGEATLASAIVSDLTSGRVVLAGTSGAIEDSANATFDGSTLGITGAITASTTVTATGNVAGGNVTTGGAVEATGLISSGTTITATGNVAGGNITTGGQVVATGNITGGNLITAGTFQAASITATGNVTGGNLVTAGAITDGAIVIDNGTITGGVAGTFSGQISAGTLTDGTATITSGAIASATTINASGAITGGSLTDGTATISSGAITGATSGTFSTTLTATGNVSGGNLTTAAAMDSATINTTGEATLASAIVSDLTSGRVVLAGTSGAIEDSSNLTFDGSTLGATGAITASTTITATGNVAGGNITTGGAVEATGLISSGTTITATGNVTGGNLVTAGQLAADNVAATNGITAGTTVAATGNVSGGNLTTGGDVTTVTVTASGAIAGSTTITATGNVAGGNITTGGAMEATGLISSGSSITGASLATGNITIGTDDIDSTGEKITVNQASNDVDFIVEGGTDANLLVLDAGADTVNIGTATVTAGAKLKVAGTDSIMIPVGTTAQRPTAATGMIRFNSTLDSFEFYDSNSWTTAGADFTVIATETFNGDSSTVAFTLGSSQTTASCIVSINGVVQLPTTAYGVSTTTLTFTEAPLSGDVIEVRQITTTSTITQISSADTLTIIDAQEGGDLNIKGNIIPSANATYDIGSSSERYNELFLSGGSITLGNVVIKNTGGNAIGFFGPNGTTPGTIDANVEIAGDSIQNGTSLVDFSGSGGDVQITAGGTQSLTAISTGANVTGDFATTGDVRFLDGDNSNYVGFQAPTTVATNLVWTLPAADGTSGQALVTDASGTLSFAAAGATISADTSTNTDFLLYFASSTSGALTAVKQDSGLIYNPSTGSLSSAVFIGNLTGTASNITSQANSATIAAASANTASNIVLRDGSGNFTAGVITATATAARYADLAEIYASDSEIEAGTVVHFAGEGKVAECDIENCRSVAGIVSTDPAYLMNSEADGVALAIAGRVPCKVTGVVNAGDLMVSAGNGMAMANNEAAMGTVIGKAIEANEGGEGVIEVLALMM